MDNMGQNERRELARAFLSAIKQQRLTGREFLSLLGNTKISNDTYNEIKNNPSLTYDRLVELFETSSLTREDYAKIIKAANAYSQQRAQRVAANSNSSKITDDKLKNAAELIASSKRAIQEEKLKAAIEISQKRIEEQRRQETLALTRPLAKSPTPPPKTNSVMSMPSDREYNTAPLKPESPLYKQRADYDGGKALRSKIEAATMSDELDDFSEIIRPEDKYYRNYITSHLDDDDIVGTSDVYKGVSTATQSQSISYQEYDPNARYGEDDYADYEENDEYDEYEEYEEYDENPHNYADHTGKFQVEDVYSDDKDYDDYDDYDNYNDYDSKYSKNAYLDDDDIETGSRSSIIISACLAVLLIVGSFFIRHAVTGAWLPEAVEAKKEYTPPLNYEELSVRLEGLNTNQSENHVGETDYYLMPKPQEESKLSCVNDNYIFKVYNNVLYVLAIKKGTVTNKAILTPTATIEQVFLADDRLVMISSDEYTSSYKYMEFTDQKDENGNFIGNEKEQEFTQQRTLITVFDAVEFSKRPLVELEIDGKFQNVMSDGEGYYFITDFTVERAGQGVANNAFMPTYSSTAFDDSERRYILIENIIMPQNNFTHSNYTVISRLSRKNEFSLKACIGGETASTALFDNKLFVVQNEGDKSRIAVYEIEGENYTFLYFMEIGGIVTSDTLDYSDEILRVVAKTGESATLNIYKEGMTMLDDGTQRPNFDSIAVVENIAANGEQFGVLFNGDYVYIIASNMFVVSTENLSTPLLVESGYDDVYNDEGYAWSQNELFMIEEETENGERSGLSLVMYKLENGKKSELHRHTISVSVNEGDGLDTTLGSDAEQDSDALWLSAENSVIVLPIKYFNGISNIEKFLAFDYSSEMGFSERGEIVYYDLNRKDHSVIFYNDYLYTFWDDYVVTADAAELVVKETKYIDGSNTKKRPSEFEMSVAG